MRRPVAVLPLPLLLLGPAACHDADAPPAATPGVQVSDHVIEHMGRGGRVRPVIYAPPPDLARPEPGAVELPFPGPGTGDADPPEPEPEREPAPPAPAAPPAQPDTIAAAIRPTAEVAG
jgi:hypothetical protein